jgi:hypothetical protein
MALNDDTPIAKVLEESTPWTEVNRKKEAKVESPEIVELSLKKVRVTITIRVPKDTANFSPAKLHVDTLHEIHKFDESLIIFNNDGDKKVNIEANLTDAKYKETFNPVEKRIGRGSVSSISMSHDICISSKAADIKEAIFPFLKKNKIFIYFNPKPGLEYFSAIGVLFGPNPDFTWRDELADLLIDTMKSEINDDESKIIGTTSDGKPKIILSLNIQKIGLSVPVETTSVALEIRVPTGMERIYTTIIERLYEKAEDEELIVPEKLGKFFPYYLKSKMPEVFSFLMRQQNSKMENTTIIPIFGYTPEARQQQISLDGETTTVDLAMATTENIIRIEATPSTWNLHKYLVIVHKNHKESVQKSIKKIFNAIDGPLENQPDNFPVPRCGGRENQAQHEIPIKPNDEDDKTMSAYMVSLETLALAQNPQDAGPTAPPKRHRRFTISYASAAKQGLIDSENKDKSKQAAQSNNSTSNDPKPIIDGSAESSLQRAASKSSNQPSINDIDTELKELKVEMENRLSKQEQQMSEIVQVIKQMNENIEQRMAHAVLAVLVKEREQIQELTHGKVYDASHAPLADKEGNLPYGGKVQLGGPLDRLHHVEVTVQQMANVLDTIADHIIQKDPSAKKLFVTDDDSENASIQNSEEEIEFQTKEQENEYLMHHYENDVPMQMIRDFSGTKRTLGRHPGLKEADTSESTHSPQRSPPSKREKPSNETSANPNEHSVRERGES